MPSRGHGRYDNVTRRLTLVNPTPICYEEHYGLTNKEECVHCNDATYYEEDREATITGCMAERRISRRRRKVNKFEVGVNKYAGGVYL